MSEVGGAVESADAEVLCPGQCAMARLRLDVRCG